MHRTNRKAARVAGRLCLLLAAICVGSVVAFRAVRAQEAPAASVRLTAPVVAVVDMSKVLRGSRQWQDYEADRRQKLEQMQTALTKLGRQVQSLNNEYENLPPGTDERRAKAVEVDDAMAELEDSRQSFETQIAELHGQAVREFFRQLSEAVSACAREQGIQLVLKKQELGLAGPDTVEQGLLLATTEVLYADEALEITAAVIERLNAAYGGPIEVK